MKSESFDVIASSRTNNFDFLRFALAVAVILAHCYRPDQGISIPFTHRQWPIGSHAVEGFFAISGCLITASWERSRSLSSFLRKRFLRIFPGWAVSLLVCVFVVGPLSGVAIGSYFRNPETWKFFKALLLFEPTGLPGVFTNLPWAGSVNGQTWTIRFEVLCYGILAGLGLCGLLKRSWAVAAAFFLAMAAYTGIYYTAGDAFSWHMPWLGDCTHFPRLITFYLAGAAFYTFRKSIPRTRPLAIGMAIGVLLLFHWQPVVLPICGTYCLFYFATSRTIKLHRFGSRGDFSYGLYVYSFPVQQLIIERFGYPNVAIFWVSATAITLILAILSWYLVEEPALDYAKSHGDRTARPSLPASQPAQATDPKPEAALESGSRQP